LSQQKKTGSSYPQPTTKAGATTRVITCTAVKAVANRIYLIVSCVL